MEEKRSWKKRQKGYTTKDTEFKVNRLRYVKNPSEFFLSEFSIKYRPKKRKRLLIKLIFNNKIKISNKN